MKKILTLFTNLLLFSNLLQLNAQSIERSVISSFGFSYSGATMKNSCTVGEMITSTGQASSIIITQGFQQPAMEDDLCIGRYNETINANACASYTLNGETYTSSGTYVQEYLTEDGCDSIITLNLTLNSLSNEVIVSDDALIAAQDNAVYEWLDCATQEVVGTGQSFVVTANGTYQVQISQKGCEAISDCIEFIVDGVPEIVSSERLTIYPNPTRDFVYLEIKGVVSDVMNLKMVDVAGKLILEQQLNSSLTLLPLEKLAAGVYVITVNAGDVVMRRSLVVE